MKILIVEDDKSTQVLMQALLSKVGTCSVAKDGEEGYEMFKAAFDSGEPFQLLLIDLMLPEINGQQLLRMVRDYEAHHEVSTDDRAHAIIASCVRDADEVVRAYESGCESYLTKPILKETLFCELRKLGIDA